MTNLNLYASLHSGDLILVHLQKFFVSCLPSPNDSNSGVVYFGTKPKEGSGIVDEAHKLISDGLETKMLSVLEDNLSLNFPEPMVS